MMDTPISFTVNNFYYTTQESQGIKDLIKSQKDKWFSRYIHA